MVIIVFISVFFVVEVWTCVELCVVLVVILDLMMRWCMLMCVDVNKNTLLSEKCLLFHTHTHTKNKMSFRKKMSHCLDLMHTIQIQIMFALNG